MPNYQYRVVPAPQKGLKAKGIRTPEARFANALADLMNTMGAEGWEYQRAETLPSIERAGLTKTTTEWRNVLVFRKLREDDLSNFSPELLAAPAPVALDAKDDVMEAPAEEILEDAADAYEAEDKHPGGQDGATRMLSDNGVEELSDVAGMTNSLERLAASRKPKETSD
ncbi:DUF4177 domain-containing protein [Ascidiaceihabitans sp.]|uniref:DUF4177 domain-containing protein n=1 Tax=Ascidiaceihabitans sp. TaxID=1872644 RepID=UPI0032992C41